MEDRARLKAVCANTSCNKFFTRGVFCAGDTEGMKRFQRLQSAQSFRMLRFGVKYNSLRRKFVSCVRNVTFGSWRGDL